MATDLYARTTIRTRRDAWKLPDPWDPILLWYANAIIEMQGRALDDPTSWRYQAAIHEYIIGGDPLAGPTDQLPSPADQQRFWTQCQHFHWYFLPWHRIYLAYFEQIVATTVADLGGPDDWALPYWNYSDTTNPNAKRLPPAFRQPTMPDGRANPLFVPFRNSASNGPSDMATDDDVDIVDCLDEPAYIAQPLGGSPGFGGSRSGWAHASGVAGMVERTPHGSMHVAVGGWMAGFNTAGLDPIFYLHHCNIDRLWVVWRERDAGHVDPAESQWQTSLDFSFHDASGNPVVHTPSEVVDTTTTPPLNYQYEDTSDPIGGVPDFAADLGREPAMDEDVTPEMVGATEEPLTLTGQPARMHLAVSQPTGPAASFDVKADAPPPRVFLNVENITGSGAPTSYAVYLNVPSGDDPRAHRELYAGLLPMFGVAEATREDGEHSGSGLNYVLEVGEVIRGLEAREDWNPDDLEVTFVPAGIQAEDPETREAVAVEADPIEVGRVSLYYT